jgi:hypothetical protein
LNECCVRQNKHKWALHPDYTVDFWGDVEENTNNH